MPPQPLSSIAPKANVKWGPGDLSGSEELSAIALETISLWSQADYNFTVILVDLIKSDLSAGFALFDTLPSWPAKKKAILEVAKSTLPSDDFCLFDAVIQTTEPSRKYRHRFAHHIFAASPDLPSCILTIDPICLTNFERERALINKKMNENGKLELPPTIDKSKIHVWKRSDLEEAHSGAKRALELVCKLGIGISVSVPGPFITPSIRNELLSEKMISEIYEKKKNLG